MKRTFLILMTAMLTSLTSAALEYTVLFNSSNLSLENVVNSDTSYTAIHYKGLMNGGEIGSASLPVKQIRFSVPYNATNIKLSAVGMFSGEITTDYPLLSNTDAIAGINEPGQIGRPLYVNEYAEIAFIGFASGAHKIVTINVYPVRKSKKPNIVFFNSVVKLNLTWTLNDDTSDEPYKVISGPMQSQGVKDAELMVENPGDILKNAPIKIQPLDVNEDDSGMLDYMIIAPDEFCDALQELVQIRRMKGYSSELVPLSRILNSGLYKGDDTDPNNVITDDAGKLRKFIQSMYEYSGVRNILLVGKYPKMPIRYAFATGFNSEIPTDLYFSDLNTKWERLSGNIYVGHSFQYDYISEVNIGRIPFETVDEIHAYLTKLKTYEFNPGNGDASYLGKTVITRQNDPTMNKWFKDEVISYIYDCYDNNVIEMANPTGADVVDQLNSTPFGCWNFIGHGNPEGVSTCQYPHGSGGLLALDSQRIYLKSDISKGMDKIANKYYPSWQFSMSCTLMPFDTYAEYNVSKNFGEFYLSGEDYGGVAMFGNTRQAYCDDGGLYIKYLFPTIKKYYTDNSHTTAITAGSMMSEMRACPNAISKYGRLMMNLLGDPMVPLFINEPYKLTQSEVGSGSGHYVNKVSGQTTDQLFLADMDVQLKHAAHLKEVTAAELSAIDIIPNTIQVVYGKNTLPCVLPLYLYDIYLDNNTIFVDNLYINSQMATFHGVKPEQLKYNGKVIVAKDKVFNVNVRHWSFIDNTLQLSENSTFNLYSEGSVEINNVYVPKGAKLIINAENISVGDYGINKHEEGFVELISRSTPVRYSPVHRQKRQSRAYTKKLAVEGRTWWYRGYTRVIPHTQECGIRIGEETTINGEIWNKVDLCLYTDEHEIGTEPTYHNEPVTIAYIKDDGHTVCAMRHYGDPSIKFIAANLPYEEVLFYLYTFGNVSEKCIYGDTEYCYAPYEITEITEITNSGIKYRCFKGQFSDIPSFGDDTTYEYIEGIGHPTWFMLMPYGLGSTDIIGFNDPELTYVTEGDDNHVIFEAAGGTKLWEMAGVESVVADPETTATQQWFNLQGVAIEQPTSPGVYIRRTASRAEKVAIR